MFQRPNVSSLCGKGKLKILQIVNRRQGEEGKGKVKVKSKKAKEEKKKG